MPGSGSHLHWGVGRPTDRLAPAREQIETVSLGTRETSLRAGAPECTNHTETELRSAQGRLAAGGVRNTKDRDALALKVRAGMPAVGCTSQDDAGFSSTNRNRVKVARTTVENGPRSLSSETDVGIRPLLL